MRTRKDGTGEKSGRLSSALIKRARRTHFAALAAVALIAAAAHFLTWRSFEAYRECSDVVTLLRRVMYDTTEVARHTQSLAGGLSDPLERDWYLHHIETLMSRGNAQHAQIRARAPQVFPEVKEVAFHLAKAERLRKQLQADVAKVTHSDSPDFRTLAPIVASLQKNAEHYKEQASSAIELLAANAEEKLDRTKLFGLIGVLLVLVGLTIEGHFLFRPLIERLAHAMRLEAERREIQRENTHLSRLQRATEEAYSEVESHRQALQDQAQALEKALDKAEEASRLKSEFLANMSHEIRTPLNGVVGMTELLARTALSVDQKEAVQTISLSAESLLRIINDILDLSKVEAGKLVIEHAPFELPELLKNSADVHSNAAAEKGLVLTSEIKEGTELHLIADSARIGQIVTNLVANAIKFTQAGSVDVSAETFWHEGSLRLKISVSDTGIGIEADRLPQLFEPFTQADGSTTRLYGGTGLGLAIVKQLAELMGGWAGARSQVDVGSVFWFVVGVSRAEQVSSQTSLVSQPLSLPAGLRILLVEDNAVNQLVGVRLLEAENCVVTIARDGTEGVEEFKRGEFDVVLMDIHMPGMDGLQATISIREFEKSRGRRTPIIAMTADAMEREVHRAMEAGMDDYLSKPVRGSELREMLARWTSSVPIP